VPTDNSAFIYSTVGHLSTATARGNYGYDAGDNLVGRPDGTVQTFDPADQLGSTTAAISLVGTNTGVPSTRLAGTITVALPAGTSQGDQVIFTTDGTAPAGYTKVSTNASGTTVYRHLVVSGDTQVVASSALVALVAVYRGVDQTAPVDAVSTGTSTTSNYNGTVTAPSVTTTHLNDKLVLVNSVDGGCCGAWTSTPLTFGGRASVHSPYLHAQIDLSDRTQASSGATGAETSSYQGSGGAATSALTSSLIALKPAPSGTISFTYDNLGDRTSFQSGSAPSPTNLAYDQAGRLRSYGSMATYGYNGDGLRMSKTVSGTSHTFSWDMAGPVPALAADNSTYYVYGLGGLPLEQISSSGTYYFHNDQLGSTRVLTNATGSVAATYSYTDYGQLLGSTGTVSNPFGYAGQYADQESGLVYMRARYYDPATAQFISRDPIESLTGQPYEYANDDPLNLSDPSGLDWGWNPWDDAKQAASDVAGGAATAWNYTGGKAVDYVTTHTIGQCVNVNAAFGIGGSAEACLALVGGKPTVIANAEGGGGTPGISITTGLLISNAQDPSQLRGLFGAAGVSVGEGLVAGDQSAVGKDACGNTIWTSEMGGGLGLYGPLPFQVFGGVSNTWTWSP